VGRKTQGSFRSSGPQEEIYHPAMDKLNSGLSSKESPQWSSNLLLCLLVIQNTSTTILARYTKTKYSYNTDHMLFIAELMKFVASIVLELLDVSIASGKLDFLGFLRSLRVHMLENPLDALKLTIPSGLFYLQNSLVYYSISLIPVPLFQITQQTKLVTTALLSLIILKRKFSSCQWLSIIALCIGSAICIISSSCATSSGTISSDHPKLPSALFGLMLIFISNLSSSIASVYFEVVIKGTNASIWMRNIQLSMFSLCIISSRLLKGWDESAPQFLHDFNFILWVQMSTFAFGGLLVASVIKYTDSVRKGLATGLSVVLSSAVSMMIEPDACNISLSFISGAAVAICGCFFFANPDATIVNKKKLNTLLIFASLAFFLIKSIQQLMQVMPSLTQVFMRNFEITHSLWKESVHVHVKTRSASTTCVSMRQSSHMLTAPSIFLVNSC